MNRLLMIIFSFLCGFTSVRYLIDPPKSMTLWAAGALLCFVAGGGMLLRLKGAGRRLIGVGLLAIFGIAGYLAACSIYLKPAEHASSQRLPRREQPAQGHTAIIYFTHGEPRTYEGAFNAWKHAIHEMDESGVPFVPWPFRPFFFKKVRDEYFEVGGSFHNLIHLRTMERLADSYHKQFDQRGRFYIAYSDDSPATDEVAARAISEGASRIILLNV